jgi:hypothetical protein
MNEKEIILKSINLLEAIRVNDVSLTKSLVEELNNNFIPTENVTTFNELIPLYDIYNNLKVPNESFEYVINNLNNIYNVDRIKWSILIRKLLIENNKENMKNLIVDTLSQEIVFNYQIPLLIQLCVTIDRYDLLN